MANTTTRQPTGAETADRLSAAEVTDTADTSPRAEEKKLTGKRVRGIPAVLTKAGDRATSIELRPSDLEAAGGPKISKTLRWDSRVDNSTLAVGGDNNPLTDEVAEFLTKRYPTSYEYMNQG